MSERGQSPHPASARRKSPCIRDTSRALPTDKPWLCYSPLPPPPGPISLLALAPESTTTNSSSLLDPYRAGPNTPHAADVSLPFTRIATAPAARSTHCTSPAASDASRRKHPGGPGPRLPDAPLPTLAHAEASDGLSTFTQTPSMQPRSLSRRGSIALQSSFSYQRELEIPSADSTAPTSPLHKRRRQRTPAPLITAEPWSLASTRSMPACPPAAMIQAATPRPLSLSLTMAMAPTAASDASPPWAAGTHRDRRRSAAHELYPPLTSIFESSSNSGDAMSALLDRWLAEHLSAADRPPSPANAPSTFGSASSTIMPRNVPAAGATFPAAAAARPRSVTHTECGFGCSDPSGPVSLLCDPIATAGAHPVARRRDSCVSLASTISTASSIISSSSDQSSYAYIFDSARPSTHGTPRQRRHCRALGSARTLAGLLCDTGPLLFGPMTAAQPATRQLDRHDALPPTERSALLGAPEGPAGDGPGDNGDRTPTPRLVVRETKSILRMAGHLLASGVLQSLISMSQVASSGRLGRDELAAIGLAHMVVILTGYPVVFGVLGCLETLASQAATSSRPQLVGAYFVRAVQTLWALGLALGAMWFTAEPMLAAIVHGAGADTAALAATYLRWYLVPFMVFATGLLARQVLCAQGIAYPLPFLTLLGALVTVGAQYLFAFSPYFQLGIRGVALGSGTGYLAMLAATLWLVCRHDLPRIWGGFSVRAPVKPFVALLPPCMLLALLSSGSGELVTMAATQLGPAALSVQAVAGALSRMFSILFSSIGIAALNRVGNLIGQRSPRAASVAAYTALCVALAAVATGAAAVVCAPEWWAAIFTTDAQVIRAAAELAPVVALAFGAQALALVGSQLLAAQGRQALAARIKFVALYAIGVPLGCYLMLARDYGLAGLWTAMAVGQACTAVAEAAVVLRTNWPWLVNRSTQSMGAGSA